MTSYFAWIVDFVGRHPHYALTAIFLLALSQAVPVVGTVVPGSTLIIGIFALASSLRSRLGFRRGRPSERQPQFSDAKNFQ